MESVADRRGERRREEMVTKEMTVPQCTGEEVSPVGRRKSDCASCESGEGHLKEFSEGVSLQEGEMQCQKARVEA